jgi:hypothetical protein
VDLAGAEAVAGSGISAAGLQDDAGGGGVGDEFAVAVDYLAFGGGGAPTAE